MSDPACKPFLFEGCLQSGTAKVLHFAIELSRLTGDKCLEVHHFIGGLVEMDVCSALINADANKHKFIDSVMKMLTSSMKGSEADELRDAQSQYGST